MLHLAQRGGGWAYCSIMVCCSAVLMPIKGLNPRHTAGQYAAAMSFCSSVRSFVRLSLTSTCRAMATSSAGGRASGERCWASQPECRITDGGGGSGHHNLPNFRGSDHHFSRSGRRCICQKMARIGLIKCNKMQNGPVNFESHHDCCLFGNN